MVSAAKSYDNVDDLVGTGRLMCIGEDRPANTVFSAHQHQCDQLISTRAGSLEVETRYGLYIIPPNWCVFIPAGRLHELRTRGACRLRMLYLDPQLRASDSDRCEVVGVTDLLQASLDRATEFPLDYPITGPIADIAKVIVNEIQAADRTPTKVFYPTDDRLQPIVTALKRYPGDDTTLADWATSLGWSTKTLNRCFENDIGMPFRQWRQQLRLVEATRLLAGGTDVNTAANKVGYSSPSAFVVAFKKTTGSTPARYFANDS